jgi:hypothetical protein
LKVWLFRETLPEKVKFFIHSKIYYWQYCLFQFIFFFDNSFTLNLFNMKTQVLSLAMMVSLTLIPFTDLLSANTKCECGTHSTGITAYTVDGEDCCNSTPGDNGFEYTYTQQGNGVWQLTGTNTITGQTAQNNCCRNT